jgi:pimeloyl-ACP methyl ester carboxylesterase
MTDARATHATTADGVTLRGEVVPGDSTWLVLVHDVGEDIDVWHTLRAGLAPRGWTILALDLRGHGGSEGEWLPDRAELDVDLGIVLARRNGATHVAVVAAGRSAITALRAVERALPEPAFDLPDSLVLLSPGPLDGADPRTLRGEGIAKLFVVGGRDEAADDVTRLREASIGWTIGVTVGTAERGAALASGDTAAAVIDKIGGFLNEQRTLTGLGARRAADR